MVHYTKCTVHVFLLLFFAARKMYMVHLCALCVDIEVCLYNDRLVCLVHS